MVDFLKYRWLYFFTSLVVISFGLFSIFRWGYQFSIEFTGGTNLQYQLEKKVSTIDLKKIFSQEKVIVHRVSVNGNQYLIRSNPLNEKKEAKIRGKIEKSFKTKVAILNFETIGPTLGTETIYKTIIASLLAVVGILVYMSFAFKGVTYAFAAILAMLHDFLVMVGTYSLLSHFYNAQFDLMFVTALLTTMSFSVHDTIVIFDKIREYFSQEGKNSIEYYANKALTETMIRSFNNSMTIVFMLLSLILMGGATIRFFIIALLIGTITGTYSSPFVATPILVWLEKRKR